MPTRKQRRRRQKEQRHEYEVVWVDEEGNELDEPPPEVDDAAPGKGARGAKREQRGAKPAPTARGVQPPSWRRVFKRAGLFAPFMFLMIYVLEPDTTIAQKVFFTAQLVLLFIPFSYLVDSMTYRTFKRREEKQKAARASAAKR